MVPLLKCGGLAAYVNNTCETLQCLLKEAYHYFSAQVSGVQKTNLHLIWEVVYATTMGDKLDKMSDDGLVVGLEPSQDKGMLCGQWVEEIEDMKQLLHMCNQDCVVDGKCLSNVWEGLPHH